MQRRAALFLLACIPFFTACAIIPIAKSSPPPPPFPSAGGGKVGSSVTVKRAQFLMGTLVELTAIAPGDVIAQAALNAGFHEIRRLENLLSTWIETSELSRVNQAAGQEPVSVSDETFSLLTRAVEIADYTDGGFNIAIGPAVKLWNIPEATRIPSEIELEIAAQYVDYHRINLDPTRRAVFLEKPGM